MNRKSTKQKLLLNTSSSLLFEVVTIICGLILPRLIIKAYGSETNGLVNSIAQFLHIVSFMDLGVGAVVQSSLYKPLADKDNEAVSRIIVSAQRFFRKIAIALLIYVVLLTAFYPFLAHQNFGWVYSALLVAAMSISYFAQYYFGVVDRLLLTANQEGYVQYSAQIITLVLNTIACVIIIHIGASIQTVKLTTSIIYLARPLFLRIYVNRNYRIDRHITVIGEPIKQKWNGIAQHVSYVILTSTDNIVLTIFSTLSNVSIYSVYHMVIYGIKQLFISMTNGIKAIIGELWAKQDINKLNEVFGLVEFSMHAATVFVFTCTWRLILPFVSVYTNNIHDAQYIQPLFATVLVLAHAVHCLRIPYNMLILATGAYKESQNMHIVTAIINLVISIIVVSFWGLVGVAVGTLVAMVYQTIWMILFDSKNNIKWSLKKVIKQILFDIVSVGCIVIITHFISVEVTNYLDWLVYAIITAAISGVIIVLISLFMYKSTLKKLINTFIKRRRKNVV